LSEIWGPPQISAASNEQAKGIKQVNESVAEIDKIVQQNAANSESCAGFSEEMNNQVSQMEGMVDVLVTLVDGRKKKIAGTMENR
jgi:methyl-accepting chemotaxis protein